MTKHEVAREIIANGGSCVPICGCDDCPAMGRHSEIGDGDESPNEPSPKLVAWLEAWLASNPEPQVVEMPGEAPPVVVFEKNYNEKLLDKLAEAESVINQMRLTLREPLELRGTMESAIRFAIRQADEYKRWPIAIPPREGLLYRSDVDDPGVTL